MSDSQQATFGELYDEVTRVTVLALSLLAEQHYDEKFSLPRWLQEAVWFCRECVLRPGLLGRPAPTWDVLHRRLISLEIQLDRLQEAGQFEDLVLDEDLSDELQSLRKDVEGR